MWLPPSVYERAPHYWLLIGLLLIIIGMYLGFEVHRVFMYIGIALGIASCIWSARIFARRKPRKVAEAFDEYLDQTCELNLNPKQSEAD